MKTKFVGIINVTPDSFSDGGQYFSVESAVSQAMSLAQSGADVIDIGAESTRPGATPLSGEQEWNRLEPFLFEIKKALKSLFPGVLLSVDTRHGITAYNAIRSGCDWINDVSGGSDPHLINAVIDSDVKYVLMHSLSVPARKDLVMAERDDQIMAALGGWFKERQSQLMNRGLQRERMIFDPGIGFGKTAQQSILILQNIDQLRELNVELLVGHSRKSFLSLVTQQPFAERDFQTLTASLYLKEKGVHYLRVHNIQAHVQSFLLQEVLHGS